jgi:hypothetical protein
MAASVDFPAHFVKKSATFTGFRAGRFWVKLVRQVCDRNLNLAHFVLLVIV